MTDNYLELPLISFVVTAYNTEKFLADCLDSILRQEGDYDFEIILVDDCSIDNTEKVARSYIDPRITYIRHQTNQKAFRSINEGFEKAKGKYIARIDSDDRYRFNFLLKTIPILEQYSEVGLVYGDVAMINENTEITSQFNNVNRHNLPQKGNELIPLLEKNYICAPTIIGRKEAWNEALPIPEGLSFCDWYLSLKIAQKWEFFFINEVLAEYRIHSHNMHTTMIKEKWGETMTWQILDLILNDPVRIDEKRRVKRIVYSSNYLILADKYFGYHMTHNAKRCYLQAIRYEPKYILNLDIIKHLLGTVVGFNQYEKIKTFLKKVQKLAF